MMNIVDNTNYYLIRFQKLNDGDVFYDPDVEHYFLKATPSNDGCCNSVDLTVSALGYTHEQTLVYRVNSANLILS